MVEADDFLGGTPVQHRQIQGHEDDSFHAYFDVVEYLDGGIESGFRHVEPDETHPVLFQVKGNKKVMTLTQVPLSKSSLNSGDSFILFCGKAKVWCWHGACKLQPHCADDILSVIGVFSYHRSRILRINFINSCKTTGEGSLKPVGGTHVYDGHSNDNG